jgi:hypothetical protein
MIDGTWSLAEYRGGMAQKEADLVAQLDDVPTPKAEVVLHDADVTDVAVEPDGTADSMAAPRQTR